MTQSKNHRQIDYTEFIVDDIARTNQAVHYRPRRWLRPAQRR